jgi:predicted DCC family thiol-disulfide oxidoreductase YuxK
VKTENTENKDNSRGEVFFDAECPLCMRNAKRFSGLFERRGFQWLPLQIPGTAQRLNISETELRTEMKLLRADGRLLGGIDTWICSLRAVWWLWPLGIFLQIPGIHCLAEIVYKWIARNRYCFGGQCKIRDTHERHRPFLDFP